MFDDWALTNGLKTAAHDRRSRIMTAAERGLFKFPLIFSLVLTRFSYVLFSLSCCLGCFTSSLSAYNIWVSNSLLTAHALEICQNNMKHFVR